MKSNYLIITLLIAVLYALFGCDDSLKEREFDTQNKVLNNILMKAPIRTINLDEAYIDSIYIDEKNIFGRGYDKDSSIPNLLFGINNMIMLNDSLYVASSKNNNIWVMDRKGNWIRTIGHEGKGPGEFGALSGIYKNSSNIFAIDSGNSRVHVFDHRFNFIESIQALIPWPRLKFLFTDSLMFIPSEPSDKNLIQTRKIKPPFNKAGTLLPKPISVGKQPSSYNLFSIFSNNKDLIIATYYGLPYLFLYDKKINHKLTLFFWASEFDNFKNPPPIPVTSGIDEIFGVMPYINTVSVTKEGDIYLSTSTGRLYKIQLKNESYSVKQGWDFYYLDSDFENKNSIKKIRINDIIIDSNSLFISTEFIPYIFKVPKPQLTKVINDNESNYNSK